MKRLLAWVRWLFVESASDLLRDEILCEITIHLLPDFSRRVYVSKLQATPATLAKIIESVVATGMDIGRQHGISIQFASTPAAPPPMNENVLARQHVSSEDPS